jgi:phenylpyruvate tautomerase PptA (4-oxalocrotonate tautomerase family)
VDAGRPQPNGVRQPEVTWLEHIAHLAGCAVGPASAADTRTSHCLIGEPAMPLVYLDVVEGRSPAEIRTLLDAVQEAVVGAFEVPERDRYQVVRSHPADEIIALDTGLGIARTSRVVIMHMVSRRRDRAQKEKFYALVSRNLTRDCGLDPADLVVSISENGDEDWSFGHGRAQFLTGELT